MGNSDIPRLPRRGRKDDDPKMIGLWKIGRTIGKGSSGRVRIARHSRTGQYAAVKIVSKNALLNSRLSMRHLGDEAERILHSIEREIVIMKLIEHPNIMRLYDVWETSSELFLILEYVEGGELFDYLCNKGKLSTTEALGYFQQIITAVNYCHRFNIAHRDLKPENLLLDKDMNIKVADFGMAIWQGNSDLLQTACGSPHYAAPEVIMGRAYNGTSSDLWSCGIILFALLTGRLPFDDEDLPALLEKVKAAKFAMPSDIDSKAQDLIAKMLEKDVTKRITIPEILNHPFYVSRPPKPMPCDVPNLDEIARPLKTTEDIDPDILANLRTLWPSIKDDALVSSLINDKPTWEKGVYHLLVRYRASHLESYDEEEENRITREREARRRAKKSQQQTKEDMLLSLPPRAGPPTPNRAARGNSDLRPDSSAGPTRLRQVSVLDFTMSASPQASLLDVPPTPADFHSPQGTPSSHYTGSQAPSSPGVDIPDVQDEKIQRFFQQIVNHLNVMQNGSPHTPLTHQDSASASPLTVDLGKPFDVRRMGVEASSTETFALSTPRTSNPTRPLSIRRRATEGHLNKENARPNATIPYLSTEEPNGRKSSLRSHTNGQQAGSKNRFRRVQIAEPTPHANGRSKLRKKQSTMATATSPTTTTSSRFSDGGSSAGGSLVFATIPRRTWLGNLFRFKPASYQLLSTRDAGHTRQACREILEMMGLSVALTQSEGLGVLKCRLEDSRDPSGLMPPTKAVKFRVEVYRPTTVQAIAGYKATLNLVLEKGAASTFKVVFNRLRREWELDTPPGTQKVEMATVPEWEDERYVEVVYAD